MIQRRLQTPSIDVVIKDLTLQRCFNHFGREAVARCPASGHYYCRECITEHDHRVICAACLRKLARVPLTKSRAFVSLMRAGQCLAGALLAWFFFYLVGETLVALPTSFHEGTLWRADRFNGQ